MTRKQVNTINTTEKNSSLSRVTQTLTPLNHEPTMLLVLGVHRSGTSVTARLLECLGAKNSDRLMEPSERNPRGYFEDIDVYNFNEKKLLPRLGHYWHSIQFIDWSAINGAERSELELQAVEIIQKNYTNPNSLFVLKEPRISILMPFWISVLQRAGFNIKVACSIRDPLSVARSMSKGEGLTISHAGMVYANNWLQILASIHGLPVGFIHFDDIFINAKQHLINLARKLAIPLPQDFDEKTTAFSSSFLNDKYRHSSVSGDEIYEEKKMPIFAIELYKKLLIACNAQNIEELKDITGEARNLAVSLNPIFMDFDNAFIQNRLNDIELLEKNSQIDQLKKQIASMEGSKIWRLAWPIRFIDKRLKKFARKYRVTNRDEIS